MSRLILTFALLCVLVTPLPARAADFSFLTGIASTGFDDPAFKARCHIRMTGEIVQGDAERFKTFLRQIYSRIEKTPGILGNPRIANLCLNSQGGSLDEALKIAEHIRFDRNWDGRDGPFVRTRLEANATCESACSIVFMAGTMDGWEDPPFIARSMHPTARLGVHAPRLDIPQAEYSSEFVTDAYTLSMKSIANVIRILQTGSEFEGNQTWMKGSMIGAMLDTPHTQMRYVETVADAGRWGIEVYPHKNPTSSEDALLYACLNTAAWRIDAATQIGYGAQVEQQEPKALSNGAKEFARYLLVIDEMAGLQCSIGVRGANSYVISPDGNVDAEFGGSLFALFHPDTPLIQIAMAQDPVIAEAGPDSRLRIEPNLTTVQDFMAAEASAIAQGPEWSLGRYGGRATGLWIHNGSDMAWEQKNEFLWIWYYNPRPGLVAAGIRPGTLLLFGKSDNGVFTGYARRFSQQCGDIIYPVVRQRGPNNTVTFTGNYSGRNADCTMRQIKTDRLLFEYVAQSPSEPRNRPDGTAPDGLFRLQNVTADLYTRASPSLDGRPISGSLTAIPPFQLLACSPAVDPNVWRTGNAGLKRAILNGSWCSFSYKGSIGFISGQYLAPY